MSRKRPTISATLDSGNVEWLRSWGPDVSFSRKLDASITLLRQAIAGIAEATADPKLDLLHRAETLIEAAKAGEPVDLDDLIAVTKAAFEGVD